SKEEIDRMVREAEANKEADTKRKEEVELKNKAEQYINSINQSLEEKGDKIDAKQKEETIKLKEELEQAIKDNDFEKLKTKIADLEKAAEFMAQAQASQAGGNPNPSDAGNASSDKKDDDVIDADFTEKKK
ncbi:MAG: Hsp70 family protein, partial [Bacilli bacterium]